MVKISTEKHEGRLAYVVTIEGKRQHAYADHFVEHDIPQQIVQSMADYFEVELGKDYSAEIFEAFKSRAELPGLDSVTKDQIRALGDEQKVEILS